jgi:hypothetical protein
MRADIRADIDNRVARAQQLAQEGEVDRAVPARGVKEHQVSQRCVIEPKARPLIPKHRAFVEPQPYKGVQQEKPPRRLPVAALSPDPAPVA